MQWRPDVNNSMASSSVSYSVDLDYSRPTFLISAASRVYLHLSGRRPICHVSCPPSVIPISEILSWLEQCSDLGKIVVCIVLNWEQLPDLQLHTEEHLWTRLIVELFIASAADGDGNTDGSLLCSQVFVTEGRPPPTKTLAGFARLPPVECCCKTDKAPRSYLCFRILLCMKRN